MMQDHHKQMARLTYDVVIATRNRPEAVALSLPLLLTQTRLAAQIFIVDSSDDPGPINALATTFARQTDIPVHYMRAAAGLTLQRNVGLQHCLSDVVIFPDDDSLLYPDAAERMMEVYEADTAGHIAAVCAASAATAPDASKALLDQLDADNISKGRRVMRRVRQRLKEALGGLNPFVAVGTRLNAQHRLAPGISAMDVVTVPYMTGFRMSFRRTVIAQTGFDEALRKYGWFEDIDASYSAMRQGMVVGARRAKIFHHRFAGARANGRVMGRWAILNRGYIVMKHVDANAAIFPHRGRERVRLTLYCVLRTASYLALMRGHYGRERFLGAFDGLRKLAGLTKASGPALVARYRHHDAD
jgi:glycosyltransferase involved in cell wall biosynthesis